ncbi:SH3 domain-containing protein [Saccharopolyspora sp. 5N102]|uniref:SH3 domain-containing protein n=1 Tax=Saccharopolyspora sp. 5N102 TaxID=3375155 RepID=UPI0037B1391D
MRVALACAGVAVVGLLAPAAQAATPERAASSLPAPGQNCDFTVPGVNIHTRPDPNSTIVGQGNPGDGFVTGDMAGNWWAGKNRRTGVEGWILGDYFACRD